MEPVLFEGDLIELAPISVTCLEPGGVYGFRLYSPSNPNQIIAHRFLEKDNDRLYFKGDRQPLPEAVPRDVPLWRVERILDRKQSPGAHQIVLGSLKFLDSKQPIKMPLNFNMIWPTKEIDHFATQHGIFKFFQRALTQGEAPAEAKIEALALDEIVTIARKAIYDWSRRPYYYWLIRCALLNLEKEEFISLKKSITCEKDLIALDLALSFISEWWNEQWPRTVALKLSSRLRLAVVESFFRDKFGNNQKFDRLVQILVGT